VATRSRLQQIQRDFAVVNQILQKVCGIYLRRFCMRVRTIALVWLMLFTIQPVVHQQSQTDARTDHAGDVIIFALPAEIDVVTGADGDEVILAGRTYDFADAQNCAFDGDPRPMQSLIVVNAGAGTGATRTDEAVVLYLNNTNTQVTEGLLKGRRIEELTDGEDCEVQGVPYLRYTGILR
jgi:hypothetical protein